MTTPDVRDTALPDSTRAEQFADFHEGIIRWSHAYPLDVFPEPDLKKAREVLKAAGMTLDSISAHAMRHVITTVRKDFEAALADDRSGAVPPARDPSQITGDTDDQRPD